MHHNYGIHHPEYILLDIVYKVTQGISSYNDILTSMTEDKYPGLLIHDQKFIIAFNNCVPSHKESFGLIVAFQWNKSFSTGDTDIS